MAKFGLESVVLDASIPISSPAAVSPWIDVGLHSELSFSFEWSANAAPNPFALSLQGTNFLIDSAGGTPGIVSKFEPSVIVLSSGSTSYSASTGELGMPHTASGTALLIYRDLPRFVQLFNIVFDGSGVSSGTLRIAAHLR